MATKSTKDSSSNFKQHINAGYRYQGPHIKIGSALRDGEVVSDCNVNLAIQTMNRHGLIAGATGTGKTKTIQMLAEQLSEQGISVFLMDLKGDLSGLAAPGERNRVLQERCAKLEMEFKPRALPVELLTISGQPGVRLRATLVEIGPLLFAKMLDLNETQTSLVTVLFKYCADKNLALLDLEDFKKILNFASDSSRNTELTELYGNLSSASLSTILRKVIALEEQGGTSFFGEPAFEIQDLLQQDEHGQGIISIIRLIDIQDRPQLFSTFMLSLLADLYAKLPEVGDIPKPKCVFVIDEAHLLFKHATQALLEQIETIIKLIRSKGVGVFFSTQLATDIPETVLSQLGMKIQHALRASTAKDRKTIKTIAENYSLTEFYKTDRLLTELGIGEALLTALDEKGRPTPLVAVLLKPPQSRMGPLTEMEINQLVRSSALVSKYAKLLNRESAYEILTERLKKEPTPADVLKSPPEKKESVLTDLSKNTLVRQILRDVAREITRIITNLFKGGRRR